jgi:hypothetical protein
MTDRPTPRPHADSRNTLAMRDLRFASTVAAGLIAGVLGVGALAAPLVGWSDWPASIVTGDEGSLTVHRPAVQPSSSFRTGSPGTGGSTNAPALPGASALPGAGLVAAAGTGGTVTPADLVTGDARSGSGSGSGGSGSGGLRRRRHP